MSQSLLRNRSETLEAKAGPARSFGVRLQGLLRGGLELWKGGITGEDMQQAVLELDER